jgi:predicted TPR repeat methyltransferase
MPGSYDFYKPDVKKHLVENIPANTKFLDVGPGYGTYGNLLKPEFNNIDAVEIWEKYVEQFNLRRIYNNVHIGDITTFDFFNYDYLIIGDVLEHIDVDSAKELVNKINSLNKKCLIAVPYMYSQGEHEGNVYETHLQPDLTHEVFLERYPTMVCLFKNDLYGYYVNYKIDNYVA